MYTVLVLLVQPSSACTERFFGSQQNICLHDYIETSIMFQYYQQ